MLDVLSVLVPLPLAGVRFAFFGVTGSGPTFSPFVPPFSVSAFAEATFFFFGEARFLGEGVTGSVPSPLVLTSALLAAVSFFVGERFLIGCEDSSSAEAVAPRFLSVFGVGLVLPASVYCQTLIDQREKDENLEEN